MFDHHGWDTTKYIVIRQPVEEAVDGHGHVTRLHWAVVLKVNKTDCPSIINLLTFTGSDRKHKYLSCIDPQRKVQCMQDMGNLSYSKVVRQGSSIYSLVYLWFCTFNLLISAHFIANINQMILSSCHQLKLLSHHVIA